MDGCLFCDIVNKKIPAKLVYESDQLVVFPDKNPAADIHLLLVPKEHITKMVDLNSNHSQLLIEVYQTVGRLVKENKLENEPYRLVVNGGRAQHVPHLHFHLLGGQWKKMV